jgi:hypothetical protein
LSDCLQCSANFTTDFNIFAGRYQSNQNGGFVDLIARPCNQYYPIVSLDPCVDAVTPESFAPTIASATEPPVVETTSAGNPLSRKIGIIERGSVVLAGAVFFL